MYLWFKQNLKNEGEEREEKMTADFTAQINELKEKKNNLVNRLNVEELSVRRLTL